jgi:cytoskeleton protein RodZ
MTKVTHLTLDEHGELSKRRVHLREISGDADAPLETVGQDLRAARLRRGNELAAVARALRIRKDHLEAIEEDRFETLPGRTYAVGFVRSYSAYLGLDSEQCVERFKKEIAGRVDGAPQVGLAPETSESRLPRGWQVMAFVVIGVVAYGAYHLARSADRLSTQPVAPVPARIATPEASAHRSPANNRLTAQANMVQKPARTPNAAAMSAPVQQPGSGASLGETRSTAPGAVQVSAKTPVVQSELAPVKDAVSADNKVAQGAGLSSGQELGARNARVVLHVRGLTRILVEGADGKVFLNRILHPGDTYRVPNLVGLSLTTPDGGAVSLELDGKDVGAAGHSGEMTEALSLDPQAIVDRSGSRNPG